MQQPPPRTGRRRRSPQRALWLSLALHLTLLSLMMVLGRLAPHRPVSTAGHPAPPPLRITITESGAAQTAGAVVGARAPAPPPWHNRTHRPTATPPRKKSDVRASAKPPERSPEPLAAVVGISPLSTQPNAETALAPGNTLLGSTAATAAAAPADAGDTGSQPAGSPSTVDTLPAFLGNVDAATLRRFYPEEARREGIEGEACLRLTIDARGRVAEAQLLSDTGYGFGTAAKKLVRLYRFTPARLAGGQAVAANVVFTVRFELH